jgi:DNA polymerase III epsilon subunit-like protein
MSTSQKKPKGYFKHLLCVDFETSGLHFSSPNAAIDATTGEYYQPVSVGIIVADADTLLPVEELYIEIKWDGKSLWSDGAQKVHGLSREYLEANGTDMSDAVVQVASLILKYWGPSNTIHCLGHNIHLFDLQFLDLMMRSEGLIMKWGNRHVDTHSLGFVTFGTYNSDDLFDAAGLASRDPSKHNALTDARNALQSARVIRQIFNAVIGE